MGEACARSPKRTLPVYHRSFWVQAWCPGYLHGHYGVADAVYHAGAPVHSTGSGLATGPFSEG
jgi:hypothetical protein